MKKYKLLEIATQYNGYLRQFYRTHDNIDKLSYNELFSLLAKDGFADTNFLHTQLEKIGIESKLVFYNNRNLQDKWNIGSEKKSYFEILLAQIKSFKPDVILISDICAFTENETLAIKEYYFPNKQVKLVGFHFTIINDTFINRSKLYDQIYTGSTFYVDYMRKHGIQAYLLRHAFEPDILNKISPKAYRNEICFCGSIFVGERMHNNRLDMLEALNRAGLPYTFYGEISGNIQSDTECSEIKRKRYQSIIQEVNKARRESQFGIDYYSMLNHYNICINIHGDGKDKKPAGNVRMFEVTGVGSCLLTDSRDENTELFDIDKEIVVYESMEDMIQKAKWLLDNPTKAREIAIAGQKRTLTEYTYKNKAKQLDEYIQLLL